MPDSTKTIIGGCQFVDVHDPDELWLLYQAELLWRFYKDAHDRPGGFMQAAMVDGGAPKKGATKAGILDWIARCRRKDDMVAYGPRLEL